MNLLEFAVEYTMYENGKIGTVVKMAGVIVKFNDIDRVCYKSGKYDLVIESVVPRYRWVLQFATDKNSKIYVVYRQGDKKTLKVWL